jgi:predicted HTH domain antitoxin
MYTSQPTKMSDRLSQGNTSIILELIILFFERKKISIGKASELAKMPLLQFQNELAMRNINIRNIMKLI